MILEKFIRKKIFVPGSRLTRETVLNNMKRSEIYQLITALPGLNLSQILSHLNLGQRLGYWHLRVLKKFEFIRERKIMKYNLYFHHDFPRGKESIIFFLRNSNAFRIYLCLKVHPLNTNMLSKILEVHYTTVQYHLNHLEQNELVFVKEDKTYSIIRERVSFVKQYYDLTIPRELKEKIEGHLKKRRAVT